MKAKTKYYTPKIRKYRKANRPAIAASERACNARNPWRAIIKTARQRARDQKIPFTLTLKDLPDYHGLFCPVFGVPLTYKGRPWCPSIDRIDAEKGYTKDNILIVSYFVNRVKNNASIEQLILIADFYKEVKEEMLKERTQ